MRFVQKVGPETITAGGRSGTPVLELPNITKGNTLKVTVTFLAKTGSSDTSGFDYTVEAANHDDVVPLSSQTSTVQTSPGWSTTTKTVFFEAKVNSQTGVEDVDFQVVFSKGMFDGEGSYQNFLMTGQIVTLLES